MAIIYPSINDLLSGKKLPVCCEICISSHSDADSDAVQAAVLLWLNSTGPTLTLGRHDPKLVPVQQIREAVSEIIIETVIPTEEIADTLSSNEGFAKLKNLPLPDRYKQKAASSMEQNPTILMNFSYTLKPIVYELVDEPVEAAFDAKAQGDDTPAYQQWELPHVDFHRLWCTLHFDMEIKRSLLEYTMTALLFSDRDVDSRLITWNRLIFLHGPPGTGKTSLCKALAQKLAIRLYERYTSSRFIEINAHSLFSKWYSESGKLTLKLFAGIKQILINKDVFVCVLIDEVESLSAARKAAFAGNEPSDSIRVVNALLTQIDSLKNFPNCLVLTTSNITEAVDAAFVDRADFKQFVPNPSVGCRYEILRGCIHELCMKELVKGECSLPPFAAIKKTMRQQDDQKLQVEDDVKENSQQRCVSESDQLGIKLFNIAHSCENFSGRALRKLPFQAFSNFATAAMISSEESIATSESIPTISMYLSALGDAVKREQTDRSQMNAVV